MPITNQHVKYGLIIQAWAVIFYFGSVLIWMSMEGKDPVVTFIGGLLVLSITLALIHITVVETGLVGSVQKKNA